MTLSKNAKHIQAVLNLATAADYVEGKGWYLFAFKVASVLATNYGITTATACGVIAALSPRNRWERNLQDAEKTIAAFKAGGAESAMLVKVCTFTGNKKKAIAILERNGSADVVRAILSGPKTTEFFNCICQEDDCCIDGHAYSIWFGDRITLANVPSIGVKLRRAIKADYAAVAKAHGLKSFEVQAITWVAWRRLHGIA
jgi:hypothetical protein